MRLDERDGAICGTCGSDWVARTKWGDVRCKDCGAITKAREAEDAAFQRWLEEQ